MRSVFQVASLLFFLGCLTATASAQDSLTLSGQISEEAGSVQELSQALQSYQFSRFLLRGREDFTSELALVVEGEANRQTSAGLLAPHWLTPIQTNVVILEADSSIAPVDPLYGMARLDRAFLKWVSGSLEVTGGLQAFDNNSANFYSPTHYFDPIPALAWVTDELLGSEGVNANCFLFDDLSLEGSIRWLSNGTNEWVARLIDRGIGITVSPSFACLQGRNGTGLELSGTFPDFQVRLEGVTWFLSDGTVQLEWVGGLSAYLDKTKLTLEGLQDTTGEALGAWTAGNPDAFYLFASAQRDLTAQWQTECRLLQAIQGGPLLFWPQAAWAFEPDWKVHFQAQWLVGASAGTLGLAPGQTGLSLAYSF